MCYLCSEFVQRLTAAMAANTKLALTSLNVSGNVIEEKGSLYTFLFERIQYVTQSVMQLLMCHMSV